jgi:hypothetical protein
MFLKSIDQQKETITISIHDIACMVMGISKIHDIIAAGIFATRLEAIWLLNKILDDSMRESPSLLKQLFYFLLV